MKRSIFILILFLTMVTVFATTYHIELASADSGFDTSYDSGGASGGSFSSDYGDSSDSSDPESALKAFAIITIGFVSWGMYYQIGDKVFKFKGKYPIIYIVIYKTIIFGIIFVILGLEAFIISIVGYLIIRFTILSETIQEKKKVKKIKSLSKEEIIRLLGNEFNQKEFINNVFEQYKDLQAAWMNFDYDKIKELVNDEIYNMYVNQLETLKIKNQQNIMEQIDFISGNIIEYKKVNNKEIFKVYLSVSCFDYIINTTNNMVVRGNKTRKLILNYILTFERNIDVVKFCPRCGASVDGLNECTYCGSKIVNNTSKIKMTKKEMISQK